MNYKNETFTVPIYAANGDTFTACTFTGGTSAVEGILMIGSADNVTVEGCDFVDLARCGIVIRSTGTGCDNIRIINNHFSNVPSQGIMAKANNTGRNNTNVVITGNHFYDCGQAIDGKTHAIYACSPDIVITDNIIDTTWGNGVSIRTSGIVRGNNITGAEKSAIRYFSDQHTGASKALYIEENILTGSGRGYPVVSLLDGVIGTMVESYYIRNNTVTGGDVAWFEAQSPVFDAKRIEVYDNTLLSGIEANMRYVDINIAPVLQMSSVRIAYRGLNKNLNIRTGTSMYNDTVGYFLPTMLVPLVQVIQNSEGYWGKVADGLYIALYLNSNKVYYTDWRP